MILVTGITGHSGNYFLQELIKNKYSQPIKCIIRENSDTSKIDESGLNIFKIIGDLNNKNTLKLAFENVDTVLHIYNIRHSITILKEALNANVKTVILVHTTGIFSKFKTASNDYKLIEKEIDTIIRNSGKKIDVIILRPTMIYGDLKDKNISKFIKLVDKFRIIPIIDKGKNLIQPVNARDLGKAYYNIITNTKKLNNNEYILSGDKPIEMIDVLKMISLNLNKRTYFINIPIKIAILIANLIRIFTFSKINLVEKVQRMGENRNFDHFEAKNDFNFKPISFEKGLKIEITEYLKSKSNHK